MKLIDEEGWERAVKINDDPYGSCVIRYAKRWAELMESEIAKGTALEACAKSTSHDADTEGVTGFMYGCAVDILVKVWAHGEELRKWHNIDCQIGTEGEKANESGGVLNPAILTIK